MFPNYKITLKIQEQDKTLLVNLEVNFHDFVKLVVYCSSCDDLRSNNRRWRGKIEDGERGGEINLPLRRSINADNQAYGLLLGLIGFLGPIELSICRPRIFVLGACLGLEYCLQSDLSAAWAADVKKRGNGQAAYGRHVRAGNA